LKDSVLFFFTDNSTVESALFKGNSGSRKLFELVVRFRKLQMLTGLQITVSHVSGRRMIDQGTDGVSRGCLKEGLAVSGMDMLHYIPLHLNCFERHQGVKTWLLDWVKSPVEFLTPDDWFERGHLLMGGSKDANGFWRHNVKAGILVWTPPPAAASVCIEEMRKSIIKRPSATHIFLCPRLLTPEWRKQLHKMCDVVLFLPAGCDEEAWPESMHEPLTLGFVFPFLPFSPWQRRGTPKMLDVARKVSRVWKDEKVVGRDFLYKFFREQQSLAGLSEPMVRRMLYFAPGNDILHKKTK
jgi:hypothetical protein